MNATDRILTTENTLKAEGRFSRPSAAPRTRRDNAARRTFFIITLLPVALIIIITIALLVRAWPIISTYSVSDLILGQVWQPSAGKFGFWPFIVSTIWVTLVGIILSVPACLLVATYLAEYAKSTTRAIAKPILDVLAAIPPVVYGVWGLLAIVPFVDKVLAAIRRTLAGFHPDLRRQPADRVWDPGGRHRPGCDDRAADHFHRL